MRTCEGSGSLYDLTFDILECQILIVESYLQSNPLFSNRFFSNQWLSFISINMEFMHTWDENILFHDGIDCWMWRLLVPGPSRPSTSVL